MIDMNEHVPLTLCSGDISHGTLRPQDLVNTFLGILKTHTPRTFQKVMDEAPEEFKDGKTGNLVQVLPEDESYAWVTDEFYWWFNETLFDAMDNVAPEGYHFGVNEGDGACYQYIPNESFEEGAQD